MIYFGADHGGYKLKEQLKEYLDQKKVKYSDFGCDLKESCDHSDYAFKVAKKVAKGKDQGILICSTGVGMAISANRVKGARAVNTSDPKIVKLAREHNDVNILALGGKVISFNQAKKLVDVFLKTKILKKTRYLKRIKKYDR